MANPPNVKGINISARTPPVNFPKVKGINIAYHKFSAVIYGGPSGQLSVIYGKSATQSVIK